MLKTSIRDLSAHGRIRLIGPDRVRFLHSMITNDVERLTLGRGCRAAMLTVKGKTVCELVVYCLQDALLLETDAVTRAALRDGLARHLVMDDVEVVDETERAGEWGVFGPESQAALSAALGAPVPDLAAYAHATVAGVLVAAAPDLGAIPGFHVFGARPALAAETLDDPAWDILRVEAGRPAFGRDVDADRLILEARLDDAIALDKGCYLGQEVVARATARGHINRRLSGLFLDGEHAAAPGSRLSAPGRDDAGVITSSVVSPRLGPIALAYVHRTVWEPGTELSVADAGGPRAAVVAPLPFPSIRPGRA